MRNDKKIKSYLGHDPKLVAEQTKRIQKNSAHIRKIIELTANITPTQNDVQHFTIPIPEPKINIFTRIKNYFKGLFYKYIIEPELKKIKIEKELTGFEKTLKILSEGKKVIYETQKYEKDRYYERMARVRKENSGVIVRNPSPLFYDPETVIEHNEDVNRELKPSIKEVKIIEDAACRKVLNIQENPKLLRKKAKLIRLNAIQI